MGGSDTLTFGDSGNDTNVVIKGDLEVKGTTVTNNVETVSTSNGVVFEGNALDNNEGTLLAGTLTGDRTYTLPDKSGTVAMTSDITGTNSGTNTGDEPDASTTVKGVVELATSAETTTGTDTTRAVTPDGLKDGYQGSTNVDTLGTITTGTWQGSAISTTYISNLSGTNTGDEPDASTTTKGIVELATTAETTTGTDTSRAVTPDGLKDGYQGSTNVDTLGTISTGTWQGSVIASAYLDSDTAHLSGTQTFTGTKTFDDLRASQYIYHAGDTDTYMQFVGDGIRLRAGNVEMLRLSEGSTDELIVNNGESDVDFRVLSQNNTHMLYVDGGNNRVGVGTSTPSSTFEVYASGSTVFDVQGSQGQLFSVVDDLSNDLFSVADISGVPILAVSASGLVEVDDNLHVVTSLGVGTTPSETSGEIRATGDITAYYSSDERLKDNITPIESPIEKLKQINGVTFDWIPNSDVHSHEGRDVGVIAQEIEKVLPEIVTTRKSGYKAVQYEKIIALLIESNKELLARVEELEEKIK